MADGGGSGPVGASPSPHASVAPSSIIVALGSPWKSSGRIRSTQLVSIGFLGSIRKPRNSSSPHVVPPSSVGELITTACDARGRTTNVWCGPAKCSPTCVADDSAVRGSIVPCIISSGVLVVARRPQYASCGYLGSAPCQRAISGPAPVLAFACSTTSSSSSRLGAGVVHSSDSATFEPRTMEYAFTPSGGDWLTW